MNKRKSARDKLRDHFLDNIGRIISTQELSDVAGISEYARRIRELRTYEGWQILSHNDRDDLKPGQYVLISDKPGPAFGRTFSAAQRARILNRNGYTCQVCGAGPGEAHPYRPEAKIRLHVDHLVPVNQGGSNEDSNLRVLCSVCNEGRSDLEIPVSIRTIHLLGIIRRAPKNEQYEIYKFLKRKFEDLLIVAENDYE